MARNERDAAPRPPRQRGLVGTVLALIMGLLGVAVVALFVSVLVEWAGMAMDWWPTDHSLSMLLTERAYIEAIGDYPLTPLQPVELGALAIQKMDETISWAGVTTTTSIYMVSAINTMKLVALRATLSLFALPGYALVMLAAFFEGLVARDIRKYTGGHESSYIFHKAKRFITPSVVLSITVYLMLPFSLPPVLVFAPTMLFAGLMVYIATSRFKKFV
ncbi:MAG: DUF4400 domain-containing protein [Parahaliea sp.]